MVIKNFNDFINESNKETKTYKVSNIEYDTDGEEVDLPNEMEIEVPVSEMEDDYEINEFISDKISDMTGFAHKGFVVDPELDF